LDKLLNKNLVKEENINDTMNCFTTTAMRHPYRDYRLGGHWTDIAFSLRQLRRHYRIGIHL
ncbi:hypothetical protein HispidOSU_004163, partial [Sigmodon hispidus]